MILRNLAVAAKNKSLDTFYGIAEDIINRLIECCMTENSSNQLLNDSMIAIMDLITVAKNVQLCKNEINFILSNFQKIGQLSSEKRESM